MDTIDQWRELLEKILQDHANFPYRYGNVITYVIVSRDTQARHATRTQPLPIDA